MTCRVMCPLLASSWWVQDSECYPAVIQFPEGDLEENETLPSPQVSGETWLKLSRWKCYLVPLLKS